MRLFDEVGYEAILDGQIQLIAGATIDPGQSVRDFLAKQTRQILAGHPSELMPDDLYAKMKRRKEYQLAKLAQPFWLQVQLNFTGVAGQVRSGQTLPRHKDLIVVAASTNSPTNGLLVSVVDSYTGRQLQTSQIPVTGHFANVANNTERFFRFPAPWRLGSDSTIEVTATDPTGAVNQLVTFSFQCVWAQPTTRLGDKDEIEMDTYVYGQIEAYPWWTSSSDIGMTVDFTGVAAGGALGPTLSDKNSDPVLLYGMQHSLGTKSSFLTAGPTVQFETVETNFAWSPTQQLLWQFADAVDEPEQWIAFPKPILLRPNTQIQGTWTNGTGGGAVTGAGKVIFLGKRL